LPNFFVYVFFNKVEILVAFVECDTCFKMISALVLTLAVLNVASATDLTRKQIKELLDAHNRHRAMVSSVFCISANQVDFGNVCQGFAKVRQVRDLFGNSYTFIS